MKIIFFFSFFITFSCYAILDYDRAIIHAQKDNWPAAQELLTKTIIDKPDRVDMLYDLGVAAYKNKNFESALNYFNKAAQHKDANAQLQEQAHFNAGNAHVQLKQLQQAIDAYDRVLALEPDHQQALHNKEVVKKMIEQQKQEQNKDQKDNKEDNKQDKQDSSDDQKPKDNEQQNQDSKNQDEKNQTQQQKNQDKNKDQDQNQDQQQQSSADKQSDAKNQKNDESDKTDENRQKQQEKKSQAKRDEEADKQESQNGGSSKPEQKSGDGETSKGGVHPEQAKRDEGADKQKLSAGLARVLEDREKKDAQLNKQLTKALVANQGGGKHDYNCW